MLTHALLPGSPAIDAGDPAAAAGMDGVSEFDQRGGPWSRVAGGRIDMGAVESQANPLPGDYNFDGVVDAADYSVWRDTVGSTVDLRADGSSAAVAGVPDGIVDEHDYAWWKVNFGNTLQIGSGAIVSGNELQAVEEESTAGLIGSNKSLAGSGTRVAAIALTVGRGNQPPALPGVASVFGAYLMGPSVGNVDAGLPPAEPGAAGRDGEASIPREAALVAWVARRGGGSGVEREAELELVGGVESESDDAVLEEVFAGIGEGGPPAR